VPDHKSVGFLGVEEEESGKQEEPRRPIFGSTQGNLTKREVAYRYALGVDGEQSTFFKSRGHLADRGNHNSGRSFRTKILGSLLDHAGLHALRCG